MSIKKAQSIVNRVDDQLGISLISYQNSDIEWLKIQLEKFLEFEIETEELSDPADRDIDEVDSDLSDIDDEEL